MRLANRVLKEAGYTLPWIADRNELLDACNNAKQQLLRGWQHAQYQGGRGLLPVQHGGALPISLGKFLPISTDELEISTLVHQLKLCIYHF